MAKGVLTALRDFTQFSVDVSELLRHPGTSKQLDLGLALEGLAVPLARVPEGTELRIDLRLDALVDGIHVEGAIGGEVLVECRRCLTDVVRPLEVAVGDVYLYPGDEGEDGESYSIEDERIDLEPMLRDEIVLALPLNPLCREDCKGLCAICGADRNVLDCGHEQERVEVRWTALESLRKDMEG